MCNIQHQITLSLSQYAINKIVTKSLHCKGSLTYFAYCKMQNTFINIALRQEERIGVWILSFYILFIHHPSFSMDITYQFGPLRSHLDHGSTINDAKAAHISGTGLGQGEAAGSTAAPQSVLSCKSCEIVLTEQLQLWPAPIYCYNDSADTRKHISQHPLASLYLASEMQTAPW